MKKEVKKVAIQGWAGANHDIAARAFFAPHDVEIIACMTFEELFETVKNDRSKYGIVAIENTTVGGLQANYTLLKESGLKIIGDYKLRIKHNLMVMPGQKMEDIKEVYSHPMALAQCAGYFKQFPHIKLIESDDTALSAKEIADNKTMGVGAVAPELAAEIYGLEIIAPSIETNKRNFTRFLIITHHDKTEVAELLDQNRVNKSSLVFSLPHEEGSLSKVLSILAFYNINLTKIQSLPIVGHEWEYLFYIDIEFKNYTRYLQSIDAMMPLINNLQVLGEYEAGKQSFDEHEGN